MCTSAFDPVPADSAMSNYSGNNVHFDAAVCVVQAAHFGAGCRYAKTLAACDAEALASGEATRVCLVVTRKWKRWVLDGSDEFSVGGISIGIEINTLLEVVLAGALRDSSGDADPAFDSDDEGSSMTRPVASDKPRDRRRCTFGRGQPFSILGICAILRGALWPADFLWNLSACGTRIGAIATTR